MQRFADDSGLAARLRAAAADTLELAQVRLELFSIETREAFLRLALLAAFAVGAAVVIGFGLSFLAVLVILLLGETHRLWALGIFAVVFLAGGLVLLALARAYFRGLTDLFAATRGEWQRDRERLWRAPVDPARKDQTAP
jgi:uncharacterized membrane protein YqjE